MSDRRPVSRRIIAFCVIAVLAVAGLAGYLVVRASDQAAARAAAASAEATTARLDAATVAAEPHLVVRNTASGPSYGKIALIPLADPTGPRAILDTACDRVFATAAGGICLQAGTGPIAGYTALLLDPDLTVQDRIALAGLPSRSRISVDGRYAVSTVFVNGHAYTTPGFSTETIVYDRVSGQSLGNIEDYATTRDGQPVTEADRNFWGVTFVADGPTFYATLGLGADTFLVRGDVSTKTMTVIRDNAACPSVSPDGATIVFKQHDATTGDYPLMVMDVATNQVIPLGETRPVDDQVSWLDNDTVVYPVGQGLSSFINFDIWSAPIDGGEPSLMVPDAGSPSVVG